MAAGSVVFAEGSHRSSLFVLQDSYAGFPCNACHAICQGLAAREETHPIESQEISGPSKSEDP